MSTSLKALLLATATVLLLFLLGDRFGFRTTSRDPLTHVMVLDTTAVVGIRFDDRAEPANNFAYERTDGGWKRTTSPSEGSPSRPDVNELLLRFQSLKVKRDMGMIKLLGERYALTDDARCRITFTMFDGRERSLDMGSSTFAPGKVGAWTYVTIPGEREVYAVEGLLLQGLRQRDPHSAK